MEATSGQGGKGDTPRPVDKQAYGRGYLRVFGRPCPARCKEGVVGIPDFEGTDHVCTMSYCQVCDGIGYVPKEPMKLMKKEDIEQ
jgi:hypothetical protein